MNRQNWFDLFVLYNFGIAGCGTLRKPMFIENHAVMLRAFRTALSHSEKFLQRLKIFTPTFEEDAASVTKTDLLLVFPNLSIFNQQHHLWKRTLQKPLHMRLR